MFYGYLAAKGSWRGEARGLQIVWWKYFYPFFFPGEEEEASCLDSQLRCAWLPLTRQQIALGDGLQSSIVSRGVGHMLGYNPPNGHTMLTVQWTLSHTFIGHKRMQIFQHIIHIGVKKQQPLIANVTLIPVACLFQPHLKWLTQLISSTFFPWRRFQGLV